MESVCCYHWLVLEAKYADDDGATSWPDTNGHTLSICRTSRGRRNIYLHTSDLMNYGASQPCIPHSVSCNHFTYVHHSLHIHCTIILSERRLVFIACNHTRKSEFLLYTVFYMVWSKKIKYGDMIYGSRVNCSDCHIDVSALWQDCITLQGVFICFPLWATYGI